VSTAVVGIELKEAKSATPFPDLLGLSCMVVDFVRTYILLLVAVA